MARRQYKFGDTFKRFNTVHECVRQTDGQTDANRMAIAYIYTALACIAACGKTDKSSEILSLFALSPPPQKKLIAEVFCPASKVTNAELVNES